MHITALVKSVDHACCRYRIDAYRSYWQALGHQVNVRAWSSAWFLQQLFPGLKSRIDVLILQRKLLPSWQLNRIRRRVGWLTFDFDDSIFLNSSYNPLGRDAPKRFEQFRHMVQAADVVIAGNDYLREQAEALTDPAKVVRIPTCIDVSRYELARHDGDRPTVKLAWIGSSSTLRGLERVSGLLDRLKRNVPNLSLRVICDRQLNLDHLPVEFCPWSEKTEARELAAADIGISWLPDDGWSAGKCGLKLLQYMAAGLPVIANSVGLQRRLIRPGENGFLADTPDAWEAAVRRLANDPALRRRMGAAGRRRVEAEFHVEHGAASWENVLAGMRANRILNTL